MKTIALCLFVYLATDFLFLLNMLFVRKWYKRFDPHYACKEEKQDNDLQSLKKYSNHHVIYILILLAGILPNGIAAWLAHSMSEKTLFVIATILIFWNIIGILLVISILRDIRNIQRWIMERQEVALKIKKYQLKNLLH